MLRYKTIVLLGLLVLIVGCSNQKDLRPKRDCPIENFFLDQTDYPPETILDPVRSPIAEKPLESAEMSAYPNDSWTNQIVVRYSSTNRAAEEYEESFERIFSPREVHGSWKIPPPLALDNLSATQYWISCGNVKSFGKRCIMLAQFEEYYVFFRADVPMKDVTYEMFRDWVLIINAKIASCLNQ
jgi:hypothetical protein